LRFVLCRFGLPFANFLDGKGLVAVQCTMGKAKILGLIIDRREVGEVGAFDHVTDDELVEEAKKRAAALGLPPPKIH